MDFSLITPLTPPKIPYQGLNFIAEIERELEVTHGKGRDRLDHYFEQNFPSSLREKLFFLALKLSCSSFLDIQQASLLLSPY